MPKHTEKLAAKIESGEIDPAHFDKHPMLHKDDHFIYRDDTGRQVNEHGDMLCDADHRDGCMFQEECEAAGEGSCMWNKLKELCFPKKIVLFGQEIDMVKLHGEHGEV